MINCGVYETCRKCILIQDPYCGWDITLEKCVAAKNESIKQNLINDIIDFACDGDDGVISMLCLVKF